MTTTVRPNHSATSLAERTVGISQFTYGQRLARRLIYRVAMLLSLALLLAVCMRVSQVDIVALVRGLPVLAGWSVRAFPPDFTDFGLLLVRVAETLGMAVAGTAFGAVLAVPLTLLGTRQLSPSAALYSAARVVMNASRGIDSFIFAILFVAAVGLGPFAGVIGIALHSCGVIAKLWSEAIETLDRRPAIALSVMGLPRASVWLLATIPAAMPVMVSHLLYVWEANVRSSTVLGLVGAGGIGQELKNSVDLLLFDRMAAILIIILAAVTIIDSASSVIRKRML